MLVTNHPLAAPAAALLFTLGAVAIGSLMPTASVLVWMAEEGPVERWTLMLYFLAALGVCGDRERLQAPVWLALATLIVAAAGRELDWHKAFTEVSIMKLSYYLGAAAWSQKLAALAMVVPTLLAALYLCRRFAGPLWRGARQRHPLALTALTFLVVLAAAKLVDRSLVLLNEDWGLRTGAAARALQLAVEEVLELGLPALVLLGLVQLRKLPVTAPVEPEGGLRGAASGLPEAF